MTDAILRLRAATLLRGTRTLWQDVDLDVERGEFVAVLGANGSGKSSLLKVILGEQRLTAGSVTVAGRPVDRGSRLIGYVPQHTAVDPITPIRVRDLVHLGLDGHRWGPGFLTARRCRATVGGLLRRLGIDHLAEVPVGQLSGGELQRVRVAEALAGNPQLLLADEPLAALDLTRAHQVVAVIDEYRREHDAAVLFVTHDINAVLGIADRVLYLAGGRFRLGSPDEVLTSAGLTDLYGAPVDVLRVNGRIVVVAATDPGADHAEIHAHPADDCQDPHGVSHLYAVGGDR